MILLERLKRWNALGKISPEQFQTLAALERRDRFSVFLELNALLYLGVLSFIAGLGWTVRTYFAQLGDAGVITGLFVLFLICMSVAYSKAPPFSRQEVETPSFVLDYLVYLGCLVFSVLLGYLEYRFHLLGAQWNLYLLPAAALFFLCAYRFDNRFVLSLALSTLAVWFGVKLSVHDFFRIANLRPYALLYGTVVAIMGGGLAAAGWKPHFREIYWHVAGNILLSAALSGVVDKSNAWAWLVLLLAVAALLSFYGQSTQQFSFVAYSVFYAYIGISVLVVQHMDLFVWTWIPFYFLISGLLVIGGLVTWSRRFAK